MRAGYQQNMDLELETSSFPSLYEASKLQYPHQNLLIPKETEITISSLEEGQVSWNSSCLDENPICNQFLSTLHMQSKESKQMPNILNWFLTEKSQPVLVPNRLHPHKGLIILTGLKKIQVRRYQIDLGRKDKAQKWNQCVVKETPID